MSLIITYQGVSLKESDVLKAVIVQLNKDLVMSGIDYQFEAELEKDEFIDNLKLWIETVLVENDKVLFNFLYRVDVNQELIYSNDGFPHENLLKLILNRELQKVVLKKKFSSGPDTLLS